MKLFQLESRLGGPKGHDPAERVFPLYSTRIGEALEMCQDLGLEFPEITTWIRANEKDFELVKAAGVKETGVLVSCSDYHIFKKMHLTRSQALEKYLAIVKAALDRGIVPRCHFEDITRADFYGFVRALCRAADGSVRRKRHSRSRSVPATPWAMASAIPARPCPAACPASSTACTITRRFRPRQLEWHGHNDFYKVVTNAATAWLYGCSSR